MGVFRRHRQRARVEFESLCDPLAAAAGVEQRLKELELLAKSLVRVFRPGTALLAQNRREQGGRYWFN